MSIILEVETGEDPIRPLPVPPTSVDVIPLLGPAFLFGWSLRDATGDLTAVNEGALLSPGAGATIVTITGLQAGTYQIEWTVELLGAAAAADANNFKLVSSAGLLLNSLNAGAAGSYPQPNVQAVVGAAGSVSVQAIGAGTVGVTYLAQLVLIPVLFGNTVVEIQDGNQPLGEVALGQGESDTTWFDDPGLTIRNEIKVHMVSGLVTGTIYARYQRNTG